MDHELEKAASDLAEAEWVLKRRFHELSMMKPRTSAIVDKEPSGCRVPDPMELLDRLRAAQVRVDDLRRDSDLLAARRRKASREAATKLLAAQNSINYILHATAGSAPDSDELTVANQRDSNDLCATVQKEARHFSFA